MRLHSIASHFPDSSYTQPDVWQQLSQAPSFTALKPKSQSLLEKVLLGDSGIDQRHFAVPEISQVFSATPTQLNEWFEQYAVELAVKALTKALDQNNTDVSDLDGLIICTCTGYLCPGLTSYVAEQLDLRSDIYLQDIVGLGCGAAIPTLRAADGFLETTTRAGAKVAVIAVEVCSAAFYVSNDPGVLISLCLFGDGASASIWDQSDAAGWRTSAYQTIHQPEHREKVRFCNDNGYLKNKLHRSVPALSSEAVKTLWEQTAQNAETILSHGGGKEVINQLQSKVPAHSFSESQDVLQRYGNLSSPSVLIALEQLLKSPSTAKKAWLTSFGAGFAAHAVSLTQ